VRGDVMKIEIDPAEVEFEIDEDLGRLKQFRVIYHGYRFGRLLSHTGDDDPSSRRFNEMVSMACESIDSGVAAMSNHARLEFYAETRKPA